MSKLTLKTEGDTHVVVTRRFAAPPEAVMQTGMVQPSGPSNHFWISFGSVCARYNEAKPGGKIRYEWTNAKGGGFYLTGEYLELEPYKRIVHVERMYLPDPTPDNHIETRFDADLTGTLVTMRMTLPDAQTRAAMLAAGMESGMEASYARLETMI